MCASSTATIMLMTMSSGGEARPDADDEQDRRDDLAEVDAVGEHADGRSILASAPTMKAGGAGSLLRPWSEDQQAEHAGAA